MIFLADESVDFGIIQQLRNKGINVLSVAENFPGITDKEVLFIAEKENRFLITEDKDFGELVYRMKLDHNGILLIRLNDLPRKERILFVSDLLTEYSDKLENRFAVLTKQGIRIKSIQK